MTTGVHGALISVSSFLRSGYAPGYLWKAGIATYPARFLLQRPCPASGNEEGSFRLPSGVKACAAHLQVQQSGAVGAVRLTRVILCEPGGTPVYENRGGIWRRACRKTAVSGSAIAGLINLSARIMVTGWYSIIIMTVTNWQINWI